MKIVLFALLMTLAPAAWAQEVGEDAPVLPTEEAVDEAVEPPPGGLLILDAAGVDLDSFLWEARIVAVLADSPQDPAFQRQMREIADRPGELALRDVVVIFDSDRQSDSPLRRRLRPRGFMVAIIEKDGEIKLRRPSPRDVRELSSSIDHFPLRRQEMLERRPAGR